MPAAQRTAAQRAGNTCRVVPVPGKLARLCSENRNQDPVPAGSLALLYLLTAGRGFGDKSKHAMELATIWQWLATAKIAKKMSQQIFQQQSARCKLSSDFLTDCQCIF